MSHNKLFVTSEVGTLKRLLVHSPDSGLGKVVPSKAQDWLFEDIVHLDTIRKEEYDHYTKLLLYFLDPDKIRGRVREVDDPQHRRDFYKPETDAFFASDRVVELQWLLAHVLQESTVKQQLVASICAIENVSFTMQEQLMEYDANELAKTFISGTDNRKNMLFAPIPNFIFTRDIGIVIKDHLLLNKPARKARTREALIAKYIFFHHPMFSAYTQNIIELSENKPLFLLPKEHDDHKVTLEGGDVMVVSKDHLLVGVSERTTMEAALQVIRIMFARNLVQKVTVIKIPKKRDYMHIDTIFTQVRRNVWVMLGNFSHKTVTHEGQDDLEKTLDIKKEESIKIFQFNRANTQQHKAFGSLEELLVDISVSDYHCKPEEVKIIFSGNNEFPFNAREQWTDSCNLLAIKEGVVLGYDRNDKTAEAFRQNGFNVVTVKALLEDLESGKVNTATLTDTLILIPSAELSRARGGFHCMSLPLERAELEPHLTASNL
jgi:arginine deiminase